MAVPELWNPTEYDALRRLIIPSFDLVYQSVGDAVAMTAPGAPRVLDLGAGTGLVSAVVRDRLPQAHLVLQDRSEGMLGQAKLRFADDDRVDTVISDLEDPLPEGPFDAVVSGLAIHHLTHEEKRRLFGRIHEVLRPGGVFVNCEQILGPTPAIEAMYHRRHEMLIETTKAFDEWRAGQERMKFDICADVMAQLDWLREAGFAAVDCLAKDWRFATYAGWKSA
jgi:tRNA (cmo5U34)-methyltransferase